MYVRPAVHETLDADGSIGQRQMAMEHGAGLEVVEVVLVDRGAERVGGSPQSPENPDERHGGEGDGDQCGDGESPSTGVQLWPRPRLPRSLLSRPIPRRLPAPIRVRPNSPRGQRPGANRQFLPPWRRSVANADRFPTIAPGSLATERRSPGDTVQSVFGALRSSLSAMRNALVRLWRFSRTPEGLKIVRYTLVSVISALTSLVILTIVFGVLRLWSEVDCTLFANVMAGIPSYILNRRWVWGKSGRSHIWREIVPFWVMSITGIGFALYTASLGAQLCPLTPSSSPGSDRAGRRSQYRRIRDPVAAQIHHPQSAVRPNCRCGGRGRSLKRAQVPTSRHLVNFDDICR